MVCVRVAAGYQPASGRGDHSASLTTRRIADQVSLSESSLLARGKLDKGVVVFASVNLSNQGSNNPEEFGQEVDARIAVAKIKNATELPLL